MIFHIVKHVYYRTRCLKDDNPMYIIFCIRRPRDECLSDWVAKLEVPVAQYIQFVKPQPGNAMEMLVLKPIPDLPTSYQLPYIV